MSLKNARFFYTSEHLKFHAQQPPAQALLIRCKAFAVPLIVLTSLINLAQTEN